MNLKELRDYVCRIADDSITRTQQEIEYLQGWHLGRYGVASHIRDTWKQYNILQRLAIKLFRL